MENCSHARRFLRYSDVVVILKSTVGTRRLHRNARMQRNDFQSSSSFDKNRESRSENLMPLQTGTIPERVLEGETGTIHYSYYFPKNYNESREYPLVIAMPGYDMMWFGEESSGANLDWGGFLCWTQLSEDMVVVSAQLTDWHETSARQVIELTLYFISHFSVDENRIYAASIPREGKPCPRQYLCGRIYMQPIFTELLNGTENTPRLPRTA